MLLYMYIKFITTNIVRNNNNNKNDEKKINCVAQYLKIISKY